MQFDILTHNAITLLHNTIKEQIEATRKQSRAMTGLTWAAVFLAVVQTLGTIIQVWIALK